MPDGSTIRTPNITPDKETGIGNWTRDAFINKFRRFTDTGFKAPVVTSWESNTLMPWTSYTHLTTTDLNAIYFYLHSLNPISNAVIKYTPPASTAKK